MPIRVVSTSPRAKSRRRNSVTSSEVASLLTALRDDPFGCVDSFMRVPRGFMVEVELDVDMPNSSFHTAGLHVDGTPMDAISEAVFCYILPKYYGVPISLADTPLDTLQQLVGFLERERDAEEDDDDPYSYTYDVDDDG